MHVTMRIPSWQVGHASGSTSKDTLTLARDILELDQAAFSNTFRRSPMKRAKLAGLQRNATRVLANLVEP